MNYRNMGKTGAKVSPLGFGMMRLPKTPAGEIDGKTSVDMLRWAIDHGLNYVDTAYNYLDGQSEIITGQALQGGYREKVYLATKCPVWIIEKPEDFDALLDEQLAKLQTDHIDFYLLHSLGMDRWKQTILPHNVLQRLLAAKQAGKVCHIGFSFHDDLAAFKTIVDYWDQWDFCQIQLNYVDTQHQAGLAGLEYAAGKGLGVVIMEPLRGGYLANVPEEVEKVLGQGGKTPVEMGLDFLWDRPEVSVVLSGMSTPEQVQANLTYMASAKPGMLTPAEREWIQAAEKLLRSYAAIPCTGCNYCSVCPQGIAIPQIFSAYNACRTAMSLGEGHQKYREAAKTGALGDACVGCGTCEAQCPQHLPISQWMPKIHQLLG